MVDKSKIQWTDTTWNPLRGCSMVSPGCQECYAMKIAHRFNDPDDPASTFHGLTELGPNGPRWNGSVRTVPEKLSEPLHWKKSRMIFVNSMSDLFHKDVPESFILACYTSMSLANHHRYQILTKRADRMRQILTKWRDEGLTLREGCGSVLPCVWQGVSVESRAYKWRIDELRETPAAVRFLSIEPLLEDIGKLDLTGIQWVIVGGESGSRARPFNIQWALNIIDQCEAARVPVFLKQFGSNLRVNYYIDAESNRDDIREWAIDQSFQGGLGYGRVIDGCTGEEWDESHQPCGGSYFEIRLPHKGGNLEDWPSDLQQYRQFPELA